MKKVMKKNVKRKKKIVREIKLLQNKKTRQAVKVLLINLWIILFCSIISGMLGNVLSNRLNGSERTYTSSASMILTVDNSVNTDDTENAADTENADDTEDADYAEDMEESEESDITESTGNVTAEKIADELKSILEKDVMKSYVIRATGLKDLTEISITTSANSRTGEISLMVTAANPEAAYKIICTILNNYQSVTQYTSKNFTLKLSEKPELPTNSDQSIKALAFEKRSALIGAVLGLILAGVLYIKHPFGDDDDESEEDDVFAISDETEDSGDSEEEEDSEDTEDSGDSEDSEESYRTENSDRSDESEDSDEIAEPEDSNAENEYSDNEIAAKKKNAEARRNAVIRRHAEARKRVAAYGYAAAHRHDVDDGPEDLTGDDEDDVTERPAAEVPGTAKNRSAGALYTTEAQGTLAAKYLSELAQLQKRNEAAQAVSSARAQMRAQAALRKSADSQDQGLSPRAKADLEAIAASQPAPARQTISESAPLAAEATHLAVRKAKIEASLQNVETEKNRLEEETQRIMQNAEEEQNRLKAQMEEFFRNMENEQNRLRAQTQEALRNATDKQERLNAEKAQIEAALQENAVQEANLEKAAREKAAREQAAREQAAHEQINVPRANNPQPNVSQANVSRSDAVQDILIQQRGGITENRLNERQQQFRKIENELKKVDRSIQLLEIVHQYKPIVKQYQQIEDENVRIAFAQKYRKEMVMMSKASKKLRVIYEGQSIPSLDKLREEKDRLIEMKNNL